MTIFKSSEIEKYKNSIDILPLFNHDNSTIFSNCPDG